MKDKDKSALRILFLLFVLLFLLQFLLPTDPTDKSRWNRSGMHHHVDHGTGCHYLAGGGFFGKKVLIPRLDKDGKQVCDE